MSKRASRRGFIGATLASVAVAPRTKTLTMGDSICDHTYELMHTASADGATK